ncbi:ATP-binding protein [Krasilnikovia sp. MM14-A1259]|uniref:ATP-binding protein n=1 Tax=Krasilnikovia sp. MM14-A1259 TaxID=3373539 RepID=UPI00399D0C84
MPLGSMYDPDGFTIPTPAIEEATRSVSDYLAALPGNGGRILAVTGEHGMGKTYLAQHVLNQARATADGPIHTMYVLARNQTFVELYEDFAEKLLIPFPSELPDLVRRVYSDIVAESLRSSELTARVAADLDRGILDPVSVVERYGLAQSDFLEALRQRLERVTSQPEFALSLTLLLRPEFEASVREWLLGHAPDPVLRERGIGQTISTESLALQAMGVFTLLYGHARIPFLLVIDELEQILLRRDRPDADVMSSFQQFLEIFIRAGGFLLLAGVPESVESLRPSIKQRIGQPVRMRPFTAMDATAIITRGRPEDSGVAALAPFTPTTIEYLVDLVGGVARTVVRIGRRLYETAVAKGVDINPAMVREAVRGEYDVNLTAIVHREIESVLSASGWPYLIDRRVGQPGVPVDYWIEIGEDAHCAVLITDFVLSADATARLRNHAAALREGPGNVQIILVVTGLVSNEYVIELTRDMGGRPLRAEISQFGEDFAGAFKSAVDRLLPPGPPGVDRAVDGAVLDRVVRQQTNVYRLLGQTSTQLAGFQVNVNRQFARILDRLHAVEASRSPQPPSAEAPLPDEVTALFADAEGALYQLADMDATFREAMRVDRDPGPVPFRVDRLASPEVQRAAGTGFLLDRLLAALRSAIEVWYERAIGRESDERLWDQLALVCQTFDRMCEELPGLTVAGLAELTPHADTGRSTSQRRTVPEAFEGLGGRVRHALRDRLHRVVG